jgi:hypothetical protein
MFEGGGGERSEVCAGALSAMRALRSFFSFSLSPAPLFRFFLLLFFLATEPDVSLLRACSLSLAIGLLC